MPATCVVVRLPSAGTVLGDVIAEHQDARVTSVPAEWRDGPDGGVVDLLALVEGVSDAELARLLLAWNRRYGQPAHVLGESLALLLPVNLGAVAPYLRDVLLDRELPPLGSVAQNDWMEQWFEFDDRNQAEKAVGRLRQALHHVPGVEVRMATPRRSDLECWEVLHFASGLPLSIEA